MTDEFLDDPTLADPDGEESAAYQWDEEFQRHIIALLVSDRQFVLQSMDLIKPTYFTNKAHQKACEVVFKYFKQYGHLPCKTFLAQEIKTKLKDNKSLAYYLGEINVLFDYFQPGLDARDYLTDKISYFAKMQSFRKSFHEGLKLLDKNPESEDTWSRIYEGMRKAMIAGHSLSLGLDYFKDIEERYEKMNQEETQMERFIIGLPGVDLEVKGHGYPRGSVISIVADSGVGKSVMLANITATNLKRGKKGVYISLEISEAEVAERMDAILTGYPVQNLYGNKEEIFAKLKDLEGVDYESAMPLVIKQFPAKHADVNTIRAYLAQLKFMGFVPDFVIIDYVGEMKHHPDMKVYESRELIVSELHGLAVEERIFIATAMQPNRGSKEVQKTPHGHLGQDHLGDSFGQMRPLTACLMLQQNESEAALGIGRGWIEKQRNGKKYYFVYLSFDKTTLRITEISRDTYKEAMNARKEFVTEEVAIDRVITGFVPEDADSDHVSAKISEDKGKQE